MSTKKKSLLGRVLGKKDDDDGGKKGKGKKSKLTREPSIRESVMSEHPPTLHSAHPSEAPLHYEDEQHMGRAPVTAMHDEDEDPYSPFDEGHSMMRDPSAIHVRPPSHAMQGGGYFGHQLSDSPRGTVFHPDGIHEVPLEHVETAHDSNVIALGHGQFGHAEPPEHISVAGVSRQPTVLAPGHVETPRMLKPGDQMEIDPSNPPTFVIDEGVTLEIGDEETGFIPYEEYLANLAKQPPKQTGGTYIVQGGGDVVIQDDNGNVIQTIKGTGANAGRGPPQIHEPHHLIPIIVPLTRYKPAKPVQTQPQKNKRKRLISKLSLKPTLSGITPMDPLDSLREPVAAPSFASLSSLFSIIQPPMVATVLPPMVATVQPPTIATVQPPAAEAIPSAPEELILPQESEEVIPESEPFVDEPQTIVEAEERPTTIEVPTRSIPTIPESTEVSFSDISPTAELLERSMVRSMARSHHEEPPVYEAPMDSPGLFEDDFDALEEADSDIALFSQPPNFHINTALAAAANGTRPFKEPPSPCTPAEELSDMSEVILSPKMSQTHSRTSMASWNASVHRRTLSNTSTYNGSNATTSPTDKENVDPLQRLVSTTVPPPATPVAVRRSSPTLTHSSEANLTPPASPVHTPQPAMEHPTPPASPPPPRPVRSPNRPSLTSRGDSTPVPPVLPVPPPMVVPRQHVRSSTAPIPIPGAQDRLAQQPRINGSSKVRALVERFEGTPPDRQLVDDASIGSSRPATPSRRGSGSSAMLPRTDYTAPWSYTPPPSRPGTPNSLSEIGERLLVERQEIRTEQTTVYREETTWELRHTPPQLRHTPPQPRNTYITSRSYMMQAIPGLNVQAGLIRELSQKRKRTVEGQ